LAKILVVAGETYYIVRGGFTVGTANPPPGHVPSAHVKISQGGRLLWEGDVTGSQVIDLGDVNEWEEVKVEGQSKSIYSSGQTQSYSITIAERKMYQKTLFPTTSFLFKGKLIEEVPKVEAPKVKVEPSWPWTAISQRDGTIVWGRPLPEGGYETWQIWVRRPVERRVIRKR
jgi:hypothetical protein